VYGSPAIYHWRELVVSKILGHNQQPVVPVVLDPDNNPRTFHRMGGQNRLLDERQNRYSYGTVGAIVGSGGDALGLKPP
jgi:hypothetical protein